MPIVRIEMSPGRTADQKAQLVKAVTDAMVNIAKTSSAEGVNVIIYEVSPDNWAIGGKSLTERRKPKAT